MKETETESGTEIRTDTNTRFFIVIMKKKKTETGTESGTEIRIDTRREPGT